MANYFTQFSEVIPLLKPHEEAWLRDQLQLIHVVDGQEYPSGNVPPHLASREPDWQGCRFLRDIEDADKYDHGCAGFGHEFADDDDGTPDGWGRHLWLHDDEGASVDCVVHLVQKFLRQFRPSYHSRHSLFASRHASPASMLPKMASKPSLNSTTLLTKKSSPGASNSTTHSIILVRTALAAGRWEPSATSQNCCKCQFNRLTSRPRWYAAVSRRRQARSHQASRGCGKAAVPCRTRFSIARLSLSANERSSVCVLVKITERGREGKPSAFGTSPRTPRPAMSLPGRVPNSHGLGQTNPQTTAGIGRHLHPGESRQVF